MNINLTKTTKPTEHAIIGRLCFLDKSKSYIPVLIGLLIPILNGANGINDFIGGFLVVHLNFPHLVDVGVTRFMSGCYKDPF